MDKFETLISKLDAIEKRLAALEKQDAPIEIVEWAPTPGESYHQGYAVVRYRELLLPYLLKASKDGGSFWAPLSTKPRKESSEWLKASFDSRSLEDRIVKMLNLMKNERPSGFHKDRSDHVFRPGAGVGSTQPQKPSQKPANAPEPHFDFSSPPDFPPSTNDVPF